MQASAVIPTPASAQRCAAHEKSSVTIDATAATRIVVRTIDSTAGFAALAPAWDRTHGEAAAAVSIFNAWSWQYEWWKVYGHGQPLRILVATDGSRTLGVLALYIETAVTFCVPVRRLRLVGTGGDTCPDDLGPVIGARGREPEVARALCDAILQLPGWDVLLLDDINPRSGFHSAICETALGARLRLRTGLAEKISFTHLPATWDEFLKSLSSHGRYRIRNARKKLAAAHRVRFFVWDDATTLDQGIDRLIYLHRKRWEAAGVPGSFATRHYNDFHRAVMKACMARGALRLYCLEVDGSIVAMDYAYRFRNGVYFMQSGFDPDVAHLRVGAVLLGYAVEHAVAEGNEVWDFLRGGYSYKDEWASGERGTIFVTAYRPGIAGWIHHMRSVHVPACKAALREQGRRAAAVLRVQRHRLQQALHG